MSLANLRREYNLMGLHRADLEADPIRQFKRWFEQAEGARASGRVRKFFVRLYKRLLVMGGAEMLDLNAMTLATTDKQGRPSARVVLLKGVDDRGFVFYTNYNSRKARELTQNPHAALVFYWSDQERQVCVGGEVSKVSAAESDAYWSTRPRGSNLGSLTSNQSAVVSDRAALEARHKQLEAQFLGKDVPRPDFWGGYLLRPAWIEFWQGRPNRLHDRFRYTRQPDNTWLIERLSP
ncbi:MAG TPA: pyridoxamine 5'-phosphate oxidase [Candidatus Acidoferrum sp.]|nr:pyridoxamine 5'-phosphate oxidase [Candidatus Acidoferrum sp.]